MTGGPDPQGFIALGSKQKDGGAGPRSTPSSASRHGARVGSHRCPILRPGSFSRAFLGGLCTAAIGGPLSADFLKLGVALGKNLRLAAPQLIQRRDVAQGTVQAGLVVLDDVIRNQTSRVGERKRRARSDAIAFTVQANPAGYPSSARLSASPARFGPSRKAET